MTNGAGKMTLLEILRAGRRNVERGWCQGIMYEWQDEIAPAVCAVGAISLETQKLPMPSDCNLADRAIWALTETVEKEFGSGWGIVIYNDMPGRTKADILNIYDKTILQEQVKEMERQANMPVDNPTVDGSLMEGEAVR